MFCGNLGFHKGCQQISQIYYIFLTANPIMNAILQNILLQLQIQLSLNRPKLGAVQECGKQLTMLSNC